VITIDAKPTVVINSPATVVPEHRLMPLLLHSSMHWLYCGINATHTLLMLPEHWFLQTPMPLQ
jgi:hypothetical protein